MRKLIFLFILGICTAACSVDPDELTVMDDESGVLNASSEIIVCEPETFTFDQVGKIDVTNDKNNLYVTAIAMDGYSLTDFKLHVANEFEDFPIVGQGNLPPGQMEKHRSFNPGKGEDTFEFPLNELDNCVLIAAKATFQKGDDVVEAWAGVEEGKAGNWKYFKYCERECEVDYCNAGSDKTLNLALSQASIRFSDVTTLRNFYKDYLLSKGADYPPEYFEPSIQSLIDKFNSGSGVGTYSIVYTVTNGDCVDSATLTVNVYDDSSS